MRKGFTLIELGITMGIMGSLALVNVQEDKFETSQLNAQALGKEIFQYNAAVSRYLAANAGDSSIADVHSGSDWLKGADCSGGVASEDFLACDLIPENRTLQFGAQPRTTITYSADGNLSARTVWDTIVGAQGNPDGMVMGVAALSASGNTISQYDDAAGAYQSPTVYCPDLPTISSTISSICDTDRNAIISTVNVTSTVEPWLRTDHANAMRHVIEFDPDGDLTAAADLQSVENRADQGWLRQIVGVARLYNGNGIAGQSLTLGSRSGSSIYTDAFLTSNGLLNGAVIVDGDVAAMNDLFVKTDALIEGSVIAGNDISAGNDVVAANDVVATTGDVVADSGEVRGGVVRSLSHMEAATHVSAQRLIDRDNASYVIDPNMTSRVDVVDANLVESRGEVIGRYFSDRDNTAYRVDPSGLSRVNNLLVAGHAEVGNGLHFSNSDYASVNIGQSCTINGELKRSSTSGQVLNCVSGEWRPLGGPSGEYAYFGSSSCPPGWVKANGLNGTVDLRGEFIRGWDNGRGVDAGRALRSWQQYMIQKHRHSLRGNDRQDNSQSWGVGMYADDPEGRIGGSNSIGYTGGKETRPRNVALLACMRE